MSKTSKPNNKQNNLKVAIAKINKHFGLGTIGYLKDLNVSGIDRLSSGSLSLDHCLSGGWPVGRIVELYGHYSSGKSLICLKTVAQAQAKNKTCVWIDCEAAFDPGFATQCGIDIEKLILSQSSIGEPTIDLICQLLEAQPDVIVIDSVASMVPKVEMEESMEQQTMAARARIMSRGLAKLNALNKGTLLIFVNQLRASMSLYGAQYISPGGRALGHYASVRVDIKRGEFLPKGVKHQEERTGQVVKFRVSKSKVGPPFRDGYFNFSYDGSIDRKDELITLAISEGKIQRKGAYYIVRDKSYQGKEALREALDTAESSFIDKLEKELLE